MEENPTAAFSTEDEIVRFIQKHQNPYSSSEIVDIKDCSVDEEGVSKAVGATQKIEGWQQLKPEESEFCRVRWEANEQTGTVIRVETVRINGSVLTRIFNGGKFKQLGDGNLVVIGLHNRSRSLGEQIVRDWTFVPMEDGSFQRIILPGFNFAEIGNNPAIRFLRNR